MSWLRSVARPARGVGAVALVVLITSGVAMAQDATSRAELLRKEREEKAKQLAPPRAGGVEKALTFIETDNVIERFLQGDGFYPRVGNLTVGSGFGLGPGYRRRDLFGRNLTFDIWGAATIKRYWATEVRVGLPKFTGRRGFLEAYVNRRDFPEEDFFGLGPDSRRDDQVSFALRGTAYGATGGVRPAPWVSVGGGIEYLAPSVGRGRDKRVPSIETEFDDFTAPGLSAQPDYLRSNVYVQVDYLDPPRLPVITSTLREAKGNARSGGYYDIGFTHFADRDLDAFSFRRFDADLQQYFGFLNQRRVIALHALLSTTNTDDGNQVPFYLMRTLGGSETLRGYRQYRFRGPHLILLQAEYRFEIWPALDFALFYDAGKVAERRGDLNFEDLEKDYGFGFRFGTRRGVFLRIDTAFGSRDGKHLYISFGNVF